MNATKETYLSLEEAYFDFNQWLFGGNLPECLITLNRKKGTNGYYHAEIFEGKNGNTGKKVDEIAMNPDEFMRDDMEVLSTLAHEMCHLWQHHFGDKKSRRAYHNGEWADKMESIGLMPSDTGEEGGKRTGQSMTHYIMPGGKFENVAARLLQTGGHIHWTSAAAPKKPKGKSGKRVKYTCPSCGLNAWAKDGASLYCGACEEEMNGASL